MAPVIDVSSSSSGAVHSEDDESEEGLDDDSDESLSGDEGGSDSEWEPDGDLDGDDDVGEEADDGVEDDDDEEEEEEEGVEEEEEERGMTNTKRKRRNNTFYNGYNDEDAGDEKLCDKVVAMLQRRKDVRMVKLEECKAYLRKHGLRLTGSKSVCIRRVQEHWRLKDGNGEKLYPKSSFVINCTGDVCKGDVILFKQRVYDKYDKVTRGGNIIGRRTVAGRVVKESYGAAKQQHTFTVEIIWSRGVKPLPALYPLLVKGRNLYRLRTFRQRWDNEIERSKVLAEKHKRGAAARHIRAIEKAKSMKRGPKRHQKSHDRREFLTQQRKKEVKGVKHMASPQTHKNHQTGGYNIAKPRFLESAASQLAYARPYANEVHRNFLPRSTLSYTQYPQAEFPHGDSRTAFHADRRLLCSTYGASSSSVVSGELYHQALNRTSFSNHFPQFAPSSSSIPQEVHFEESFRFPMGMQFGRQTGGGFHCQTPGCWELAGNGCLNSCCRMCCSRNGRRCNRHL